ncbi:Uncharacterised protein [Neisseria gonorrhoeae]|uniref:Uncharacterized protein n=1 Tax=Neisseria gonorrhoeae TaxID=485 RepID=A0A378VUS3_NEIGO|nr:Uncharacterised protein [Neisseria gonorrhoeae]
MHRIAEHAVFSVAFADTVTFRADDMLPVNTNKKQSCNMLIYIVILFTFIYDMQMHGYKDIFA